MVPPRVTMLGRGAYVGTCYPPNLHRMGGGWGLKKGSYETRSSRARGWECGGEIGFFFFFWHGGILSKQMYTIFKPTASCGGLGLFA